MGRDAVGELAQVLLRLLAAESERTADRVVERLRAEGFATGAEYTSAGPLPAGVGRARFNRVAATIVGATKDGRCWRVTRSAWDESRSRRSVALAATAPVDDEETQLLEAAGLRRSLRVVNGGGR